MPHGLQPRLAAPLRPDPSAFVRPAYAGAAVVCLLIGYLTRDGLNPDGVWYLDLAATLAHGDVHHFVQGYWSPLYPLALSLPALVVRDHRTVVYLTHVVNVASALAGLAILLQWAHRAVRLHQRAGRVFAFTMVAIFLLCSLAPPRVETVTPDVLLLAIMIALSYELLACNGTRWPLVGVLLGATFLAKTSAWPWLLVALPVRLIAAGDAAARRRVFQSSAVAAAVMSTWIVPLSIRYGHFTLGSAGRLNYSWYIAANSSRLPDTDRGENSAYIAIPGVDGATFPVAVFDEPATWTYQPWGDPTGWQARVTKETGRLPRFSEIAGYWLRALSNTFLLWLGPRIATVLVALFALQRWRGTAKAHDIAARDAVMVTALGFIGLMQFVAVHAEPRLIAPFAAMFGLGAASWCCRRLPADLSLTIGTVALAGVGLLTGFGVAIIKIASDANDLPLVEQAMSQVEILRDDLHAPLGGTPTIAVLGPVAPVMRDAYLIGAHVAVQIPPRALPILGPMPLEARRATIVRLLSGRFAAVWQSRDDGGIAVLRVPAP